MKALKDGPDKNPPLQVQTLLALHQIPLLCSHGPVHPPLVASTTLSISASNAQISRFHTALRTMY